MKKTFKWTGFAATMTKMLACLTISTMLFTSCEDAIEETVSKNVESITMDPTELALTVGDSSTLTVTFTPEDAFNQIVTWSSSDDGIASVSGGTVTAVAQGTATITATSKDGGYTASCEVTVSESF